MFRISAILFFIPLFFYMLCFPKAAFEASCSGLILWFQTVLPSLLPFIIVSNFLTQTGIPMKLLKYFRKFFEKFLGLSINGGYAFLMGIFCGYPMGAKVTADLLRCKQISQNEAEYLLTISNNASPMFISSILVLKTLGMDSLMMPTFLILYTSCLLNTLFWRIRYRRFGISELKIIKNEVPTIRSWGALIDTSIMNGFEAITKLGGYIILFTVFSTAAGTLLKEFPYPAAVLTGLTEMTTGIRQIVGTDFPFTVKYALILSCASFGGLSTAAQTKCMLPGTNLDIRIYILAKTGNGLLTFLLTLLLVGFFI